MHVCFDSIGCRLNWSEVEILAREFAKAGHVVVGTPAEADAIIVNTCAVTAQAERKTRHRLRALHRENPEARIAVVGCYPTLREDTSRDFPGVAWVIPNARKSSAAELVTAEGSTTPVEDASLLGVETLRTRAFVKVQDGCDNHCTYCIVPSLRGSSCSRPMTDVIHEVQMAVHRARCKEVVLTGANLAAYGRDLGVEEGLRSLVKAILSDTDVARLRLSSLEPWDIDEQFFELWGDPRLCRQLHLPLQAGCDATLRRMGRPVRLSQFERLVEAARGSIPDVAVTTDILVGFPGEDQSAFRDSHAFVERMVFAKLHVFPYSPRPGTPATRLPAQVSLRARDDRARRMRVLGTEQRRRFKERFLGREMEVLWEKRRQDMRWTGWTDNYVRVVAADERDLLNRITPTRLVTPESTAIKGEVLI